MLKNSVLSPTERYAACMQSSQTDGSSSNSIYSYSLWTYRTAKCISTSNYRPIRLLLQLLTFNLINTTWFLFINNISQTKDCLHRLPPPEGILQKMLSSPSSRETTCSWWFPLAAAATAPSHFKYTFHKIKCINTRYNIYPAVTQTHCYFFPELQ